MLAVHVHPASIQDRDGAEALLREARRSFPFIERIIGDAGYQGQKMQTAVARTGSWELQVVRRWDRHRFVVLPDERTLGWISRCVGRQDRAKLPQRLAPLLAGSGRSASCRPASSFRASRSSPEPCRPVMAGCTN